MEIKMTVVNFEDIKLNDSERQPCEVWTRVICVRFLSSTKVKSQSFIHVNILQKAKP